MNKTLYQPIYNASVRSLLAEGVDGDEEFEQNMGPTSMNDTELPPS